MPTKVKKNDIKKLLLEKELISFLRDKKKFFDDISELSSLLTRFEIMYGIKLQLVYEK